MSNLSTLKRLAVCMGCCERTEDITADSNADAIKFICDHLQSKAGGITDITIEVGKNGKVTGGYWTDSAGTHEIKIV